MVLGALAQSPHHPTLVAYGDVETTPYLVMEFVEGARLSDWVRRAPIAPEEIARLGAALALALHDLHRQDVVHLDLKPTNVIYRPSGEAVLIDFGLAHHGHYPGSARRGASLSGRQLGRTWRPSRCSACAAIRAATSTRSAAFSTSSPPGDCRSASRDRSPNCASGCIAIRFRRAPSYPQRRPGCRRSSFVASRSTRAKRYASSADVAFDLANPAQVALTERAAQGGAARAWVARAPLAAGAPLRAGALPAAGAPGRPRAAHDRRDSHRRRSTEAHRRRSARRGATADRGGRRLPHRLRDGGAAGRRAQRRGRRDIRRPAATSSIWSNCAAGREPLELPEERVTYHVLKSDKPARR